MYSKSRTAHALPAALTHRHLLPALLVALAAALGVAGPTGAVTCELQVFDAEDAVEVGLDLGKLSQKARRLLEIVEKASKPLSAVSPPTEGLTDGYVECFEARLDAVKDYITSFNLRERTHSVAETSGRNCSDYQAVVSESSKQYDLSVLKTKEAIKSLRNVEDKLTAFSRLTGQVAALAKKAVLKGMFPLDKDWYNLTLISERAIAVQGDARNKRETLEKNLSSYEAKQANLKSWMSPCPDRTEENPHKAPAEANNAVDPHLVEFALSDAERSRAINAHRSEAEAQRLANSAAAFDSTLQQYQAAATQLSIDQQRRNLDSRSSEHARRRRSTVSADSVPSSPPEASQPESSSSSGPRCVRTAYSGCDAEHP